MFSRSLLVLHGQSFFHYVMCIPSKQPLIKSKICCHSLKKWRTYLHYTFWQWLYTCFQIYWQLLCLSFPCSEDGLKTQTGWLSDFSYGGRRYARWPELFVSPGYHYLCIFIMIFLCHPDIANLSLLLINRTNQYFCSQEFMLEGECMRVNLYL